MSWPLSQDYNEAIQSPATNFADPDLRRGEAVTNKLGLPMPYSGNFADVYQVRCPDGGRWAVKCFTREAPGLRERYQEISRHLRSVKLPFIVDFTYLERGIRVVGKWHPVLKMEWVEGLTLNQFVGKYADDAALLEALSRNWGRMAKYLRMAKVGHCDLQHGNVLLVPGANANSLALKLIDYDGMWVPALAGTKSGEVGHACYQHPRRLREQTYSIDVDRFPVLLIATALRALQMKGRVLWEKYDNGDNLLFKEADLLAPLQSHLFLDLTKTGDALVRRMMDFLVLALRGSLEKAPLLEDVVPETLAGSSGSQPALRSPRSAALQVSAPAPFATAPAAKPAAALRADNPFDFGGTASAAPVAADRGSAPAQEGRIAGVPVWVWAGAVTLLVVALGVAAAAFLAYRNPVDNPPAARVKPVADRDAGAGKPIPPNASKHPSPEPQDKPGEVGHPVAPAPAPEAVSPLVGTWQVDHDGLNEIWTIKADMGDWSVSGSILDNGKEIGSFKASEVQCAGGTLGYRQKWITKPPNWADGVRITARINDNKLRYVWATGEGGGTREMARTKPEPPAAAEPGKGFTNSIGMKLVLIPAGKFLMGSPANEQSRNEDEGPQHEVEIGKPFYMGAYLVTNGQFAAFVQASGYRTEAEKDGKGGYGLNPATLKWEQKPEYTWRHPGFTQGDDHPVVDVSWNDVTAFCAWLSKKEGKPYGLPTEAEWEYACRAGTKTRFWCGDTEASLQGNANIRDASFKAQCPGFPSVTADWDDGYAFTSPVGRFRANAWGLHDMLGNVWQWCADGYGPYQERYIKDPNKKDGVNARTLRGGSWYVAPPICRSALRLGYSPAYRPSDFGFRVVLRSDVQAP